jgi:DNA-binding NtrC family response regulator
MAYDWPGNVRELENIIERSMILSPGSTLLLDGLPRPVATELVLGPSTGVDPEPYAMGWRTLEEVERDHILSVCERCGWRINGKGNAAERLGINPNTLRSRMQKLGIARPASASGVASPGALPSAS